MALMKIEKQDNTTETLNNLDGLTLGHLLSILKKLKLTALVSIATVLGSVLGGAYLLGRASTTKQAAVMLRSPFAMRLAIDGHKVDFQNLILLKDPALVSPSQDTVILSLREIRDEFDVFPVGLITAKVEKSNLSWPWKLFAWDFGHNAWAADEFSFGAHQGDFNYTEEFVDAETVLRTYEDGCQLQYQVDSDRKSVRTSFKWLKNVH
jgi:hypothetical protein